LRSSVLSGGRSPARVYRVELGHRSYDIHIESDGLRHLGAAMRRLFRQQSRCLVVSNVVVAPLYLGSVKQGLEESGWKVAECILPDGERYKTLATWKKILDTLMRVHLSRDEPLVALGGGVIGDMAGFAAACYRRGIPCVQVPTTLLAQVDSSVGGKTGINHPLGKNMIGALHQPRLVWIDPCVLRTLDRRQLLAGVAEVIKYGLIRDADFFHRLSRCMDELLALEPKVVSEIIFTSCRHKAEVVMADETEQGVRALLNLGHTFGHAIEAMSRYRRYLHGEAVALGTCMAARLSEQLGYAKAGLEERIRAVYRAAGLPVEIPAFPLSDWFEAMMHDKKAMGGRLRFVLLRDVGDAFVSAEVTEKALEGLLCSYRTGG